MSKLFSWFNHDLFLNALIAAGEIFAAWLIARLIHALIIKVTSRSRTKGIFTFLASLVSITIEAIGIILALDQLGVKMSMIVGVLTALGVGISLALKENMSSVASGIQILLTNPFKIGDYIRLDDYEGVVISIELTYIVIKTESDNTVLIPNNKVISKSCTNYSTQPTRRMTLSFHAPAGKSEEVWGMIKQAIESCPLVLKEPAYEIWIESINKNNGCKLTAGIYTKTMDYWNCKGEILEAMDALLNGRPVPKEQSAPVSDQKESFQEKIREDLKKADETLEKAQFPSVNK
jgi:small conductance mechanosensitive channel